MDGFELTKLCIQFDFGRSNAVAKAVLVALASHYSEDNGKVWPGSDALCREAACQRNALFAAIKWLREAGLIETKRTWTGNVYTFNYKLIRQGGFEPRIENDTTVSIESDTSVSIENDTSVSIENDTKLSIESVTYQSNASDTYQSIESDTYQSIESDTQTNKEQIKEQIINQSVPMGNSVPVAPVTDLKNCFQSFGSNPVSRPTQWEPVEDDFDQPLRNQIAQAQRIDVNLNDESRILSASEMVVLAATLGYRLTHNVVLDEIADERVITTGMMKEAIQRAKDRTYGVGGLVRILQNAVRDPMAFNGIRKKPDVTPDSLSDGQAYHFAKRLANYHPWASHNAKYMETTEQMIERVSASIKSPEFFNNCRWALEKLGLVKEAANV